MPSSVARGTRQIKMQSIIVEVPPNHFQKRLENLLYNDISIRFWKPLNLSNAKTCLPVAF